MTTGAGSGVWRASNGSSRDDALLLDTHIWFWTLTGMTEKMSDATVALIEAAAEGERLFVSDISYWEISLKARKGKLALTIDPTLWLARAARAPGIRSLPVGRDVLIQSTLLPDALHGDPADRILIAHAQLGDMALVTCDAEIVAFAEAGAGVRACDGRR